MMMLLLVVVSAQIAMSGPPQLPQLAPPTAPAIRTPSLWAASFFPWDALDGTCSYGPRIPADEDPTAYFARVESRNGDPRAIRDNPYRRALDLDCFLTWRPPAAARSGEEPLLNAYLRAGLAMIDGAGKAGSLALARSAAKAWVSRARRERFGDPVFFIASIVFEQKEFRCAAELYTVAAGLGSVAAINRADWTWGKSNSGLSGRTCDELGIVAIGDIE